MRRITSTDAQIDEHGTGRNGFTDGVVGTTPATHLNADWFDNVQEELARCVEGDGATIVAAAATPNYFQLDDAVGGMSRIVAANATADYVLEGFTIALNGASLTVTPTAGRYVFNGRRYVRATAMASVTVTASRDTYFYVAPENPGALVTPPNRATIYQTTVAVANGAATPATPAGTMLYAMVVSNGSGTTAVTYYNRGPRLVDENGASVVLRPGLGSGAVRACLHPSPTIVVDLGYDAADSNEGYFNQVRMADLRIRTAISALYTSSDNRRYTVMTSTAAASTTDITLLLAADVAEGMVAYIRICGTARDSADPTDNYSFRIEGHVQLDGGVFSIEGSGATPAYEDGDTAIADTISAALGVTASTTLRLRLTGHTTDSLLWFFEVHMLVNGN